MKGIIRKIELVTRNKKDGKTFRQIVMTVDVIYDEEKRLVKSRKAYFNEQYIKEYAAFCNLKSSEMIGKTVNVVLEKKIYEKDGLTKTCETIKYLNFLDSQGQSIIMKKEDKLNELGF